MSISSCLSSGFGLAGRAIAARAGGPILDKELRVAGRRRLTYLMRVIYIAVMALFVVGAWSSEMGLLNAPPIQRQMRMAMVGQAATFALLWFQFFALQLVAAVLLAGAIGDEIVRRTLDVLLSTPITPVQIVAGKLASRLLNLLLLASLSLPVMLVIRVFGGVSAEPVVGGVAITLTAALFAGSLSLFFSAGDKRPWLVIMKTAGVYISFFAALPIAIMVMFFISSGGSGPPPSACTDILAYINPFVAMFGVTIELNMGAGRWRGGGSFLWLLHCGLMITASAILFAATVRRVRRVALQQLISPGAAAMRGAAAAAAIRTASDVSPVIAASGMLIGVAAGPPASEVADASVRRVSGPPMIWKELRHRVFRSKAVGCLLIAALIAVLGGTYLLVLWASTSAFGEWQVHAVYVVVLFLMASIVTTILAAVPIASEREARTWGQLLATPLTEREILFGKAVGIWRRCLPAWVPLFAHLAMFFPFGIVHPVVILHIMMIVCGFVALTTGTGLYFSAVARTGTRAVLANLGLHGFLWAGLPGLVGMILGPHEVNSVEVFLNLHPLLQAGGATQLMGQGAWTQAIYQSHWPGRFSANVASVTLLVSFTMAAYVLIGLGFAKLAARRIRAEKA